MSKEPQLRRRFATLIRRHPTAAFYTLLIAATLCMGLLWHWRVESQLAELHRQATARGEPATAADLAVPHVSSDQNAWPLLMSAAAAITVESPLNGNTTYPDYPPFGDAWERVAEVSSKSNTKALGLLREVRSRSKLQMRDAWPNPMVNAVTGGGFGEAREICNVAADDALYQHVRGNHVAAIERLLDILHIARLMQQEPTLIGQLVATGLASLAESRIAVIAPGLPAGDREVRRLMRELIADLGNESGIQKGFAAAWALERIMTAEMVEMTSGGVRALRPLARRAILDDAYAKSALVELTMEPSAPAAQRRFDQLNLPEPIDDPFLLSMTAGPRKEPTLPDYARWFNMWTSDTSLRRMVDQPYRGLASRRTTVLIVALQLYRADNGGRWPATLGELAPTYLPAIPADPFHEDGRPIGYVILRGALPGGGDRPLVYFDTGPDAPEAIDVEPMIDWQWDRLERKPPVTFRQYRDVARWSPATRRIDVQIEAERVRVQEQLRQQQEFERMEKEEAERLKHEPSD